MKFRDWAATTQSTRLLVSLCAALLIPLLAAGLQYVFYRHDGVRVLYQTFLVLFMPVFLIGNLYLFTHLRRNHPTYRVQYTLFHLMLCVVVSSLFLAANFTHNPKPLGSSLGDGLAKSEVSYGFPFEMVRQSKFENLLSSSAAASRSFEVRNIAFNAAILLLLVTNILVLQFKTSETKQD